MNAPKRHHFIPQMMLRNFADADGQLWFWRRGFPEGEVKKANTQNLFVEKDLYTLALPDGAKDITMEKFLSAMEGVGAKFIGDLAGIVRDGVTPDLDEGAWEFWNLFFYYHLKRAPGAIDAIGKQMEFDDKIDATVEKIRAILEARGKDRDEPGLRERVRKNAVIIAQRAPPAEEVLATFRQLGLAIYRITDLTKSFIVGDIPGAMARFRIPGVGLSRPILFLPLTWDIAVGQLARPKAVEVVNVDREQIRRMNEATTARCEVIAGRSEALIGSLSKSVIYCGVVQP